MGAALSVVLTRVVPRAWVFEMLDHDLSTMRIALEKAQDAAERGEAPIGAEVLDPATGEVIAAAGNSPISLHDPTAHAEILALRAAASKLGNYRLTGLTLVVTLEPCAMCAGAISHARIGRVVARARTTPRAGAVVHSAARSSTTPPATGSRRFRAGCWRKRARTCCGGFSGPGGSRVKRKRSASYPIHP